MPRQAAVLSGAGHAPLWPYAPSTFWRRDNTAAPRAADQTPALRFANQLNYDNATYDYLNRKEPPRFYNYSGVGSVGGTQAYASAFLEWNITVGMWLVPANHALQRVALVEQVGEGEGNEEHERPPGAKDNLQSFLEAVPVPDPSLTIKGLVTTGTDHGTCICQGTKLWELWRFQQRQSGEWRTPAAGYTASVSEWAGNWFGSSNPSHTSKWGVSASGLSLTAGLISWRDVEEVLRGEKANFGHALKVICAVTQPARRLPAHSNDTASHTPQFYAGTETPNPAFGFVDQVAEGSTFVLPSSSRPSDYGISRVGEPLAWAFFETLRIYGCIVVDGGGNTGFRLEWPGVLGSIYSPCRVNPLANYEGQEQVAAMAEWNELIGPRFTDPSLARITESFTGPHGIGWKLRQAYPTFELLEEYSS